MNFNNLNDIADEILEFGNSLLNTELGIISKIDGEIYEVNAVKSKHNIFKNGERYPLKETFCREVVKNKSTIAITEIDDKPGLQLHPLYIPDSLECYIGAPLYYKNEIVGTLNFSSMKIRDSLFSEEEIKSIKDLAAQISSLLEI